jgi:hypothetical protein
VLASVVGGGGGGGGSASATTAAPFPGARALLVGAELLLLFDGQSIGPVRLCACASVRARERGEEEEGEALCCLFRASLSASCLYMRARVCVLAVKLLSVC